MQKRLWAMVAGGAWLLQASSAGAAPAKDVDKCMKIVGKEVQKYVAQYAKTVSKCDEKITKETVAKDTDGSSATAACVRGLNKIINTEKPERTLAAKMEAKILKKCTDPVTAAALTSAADEGPNIGGLLTYCSQMDDGTIDLSGGNDTAAVDSIEDWVSCLTAAATCTAQATVAGARATLAHNLRMVLMPNITPGLSQRDADAYDAAAAVANAIDSDGDGMNHDIVCGLAPDPQCGNDVQETVADDGVSRDEQCDGTDLDGATCETLGFSKGGTLGCTSSCQYDVSDCSSQHFAATGQVISWPAMRSDTGTSGSVNDDGATQNGAAASFTDNGNGTLTDDLTGLVWLTLSSADSVQNRADPTDPDNTFAWSSASDKTIWESVDDANTAVLGGRSDWRVANLNELLTLVNRQASNPASYAAVPNVQSDLYFTSSTFAASPTTSAWIVDFSTGAAGAMNKSGMLRVMLVSGPDL